VKLQCNACEAVVEADRPEDLVVLFEVHVMVDHAGAAGGPEKAVAAARAFAENQLSAAGVVLAPPPSPSTPLERWKARGERLGERIAGSAGDLADSLSTNGNVFIGWVAVAWILVCFRVLSAGEVEVARTVLPMTFSLSASLSVAYGLAAVLWLYRVKRMSESPRGGLIANLSVLLLGAVVPLSFLAAVATGVWVWMDGSTSFIVLRVLTALFLFFFSFIVYVLLGGAFIIFYLGWGAATTLASAAVAWYGYRATGVWDLSLLLEILTDLALSDVQSYLLLVGTLALSHPGILTVPIKLLTGRLLLKS
jgi:hypothetical protein